MDIKKLDCMALCRLTVQADASGTDIISAAHSLYFYGETMNDAQISAAAANIRKGLAILNKLWGEIESQSAPSGDGTEPNKTFVATE